MPTATKRARLARNKAAKLGAAIEGGANVLGGKTQAPAPAPDEWAWVDSVTSRTTDGVAVVHQKQCEFVKHPAKRKVACAGRQSAKSTAAGIAVVDTLLKHEGQALWIGLSKAAVERTTWPEFKRLLRGWGLLNNNAPDAPPQVEITKNPLSVTFPNGSIAFFVGTDDAEHMESFRGSTNRIVVLEEVGAQAYDLVQRLVEEIIEPSLLKHDGPLLCIGTPPPKRAGWFANTWFDALNHAADPDGWFKSKWTGEDNPFIPNFIEQVKRIAKTRGVDWQTDPSIRREYFAEWIEDDELSVYYLSDSNLIDGRIWKTTIATHARAILPRVCVRSGCRCIFYNVNTAGVCDCGHPVAEHVDLASVPWNRWRRAVGIDPAQTDCFSIQLIGECDVKPTHYWHLAEWQAPKSANTVPDTVAGVLKDLFAEFGGVCRAFINPGGGKVYVADLATRHSIRLEIAAKKGERMGHIERVNNALTGGRYHVIKGSQLATDYKLMQWKPRINPERIREYDGKIHKGDAHDAARYGLVGGFWEAATPANDTRTDIDKARARRQEHIDHDLAPEADPAFPSYDDLDREMSYRR